MKGAVRRVLAALALVAACSKSEPSTGSPSTGSASTRASAQPGLAAVTSAPSAQAGAAAVPIPLVGRWAGTYVAKVGAVAPPKAANEKAWADDPGATATGNGAVELVVGEPAGEARGHLKGPLGDLVVAGTFDGRELYADLRPSAPNGEGALTGVMKLVADGPAMKGSARLSAHDGKTVREADLNLKRQ